MILLYVAALYFKLVSHRGVYVAKQEITEGEAATEEETNDSYSQSPLHHI